MGVPDGLRTGAALGVRELRHMLLGALQPDKNTVSIPPSL